MVADRPESVYHCEQPVGDAALVGPGFRRLCQPHQLPTQSAEARSVTRDRGRYAISLRCETCSVDC